MSMFLESPRVRLGRLFLALITLPLLGSWACQTSSPNSAHGHGPHSASAQGNPAQEAAWAAPDFERSISVRDGHDGRRLSWDEFVAELAEAEAVFLGETHIDECTHRVELAVYEAMLHLRPGEVTLAMEMFQRDAQETLDAYLAGDIEEKEFLATAHPWGNYASAYRPMIELAKECGGAVVGSNFPNALRRRVATEGAGFFADATDKASSLTPAELKANTAAYWRRVDNAVRGHIGMMGPQDEDSRLVSAQSLWDNSMGESCATVLDENPGEMVVHVNGGFHSEYWDGTVRQMLLRRPETKVKTIAIVPVGNPNLATLDGAPVADYVVFAHSLATDINEGTHSVYVQRELKYRLHMPKDIAPGTKVPLLIWLVDRGLNAQDGIDLWRSRLGDSAAIVAVEPPYQAVQDDQSVGGRWYWPEGFGADTGFVNSGIGSLWGYLARNFPIDPTRVCLAGEGTGATVVSVVTLFSSDMPIQGRAFSPRHFSKIKDMPLPLPEYMADDWGAGKNLQVYTRMEDQEWWAQELSEYQQIGMKNELHLPVADGWAVEGNQENQLRSALGLPPKSWLAAAPRYHIVLNHDSQRARHWARLIAAKYSMDDGGRVAIFTSPPQSTDSKLIPTQISVMESSLADALPSCPGPFGGTTVLVVPQELDDAERMAWSRLATDDPLTKRNRFLRLRLAGLDEGTSLAAVLKKLESENRKNILIVPAAFCASADSMRALRESVKSFEDRLTLHWQAGLGGSLAGQ